MSCSWRLGVLNRIISGIADASNGKVSTWLQKYTFVYNKMKIFFIILSLYAKNTYHCDDRPRLSRFRLCSCHQSPPWYSDLSTYSDGEWNDRMNDSEYPLSGRSRELCQWWDNEECDYAQWNHLYWISPIEWCVWCDEGLDVSRCWNSYLCWQECHPRFYGNREYPLRNRHRLPCRWNIRDTHEWNGDPRRRHHQDDSWNYRHDCIRGLFYPACLRWLDGLSRCRNTERYESRLRYPREWFPLVTCPLGNWWLLYRTRWSHRGRTWNLGIIHSIQSHRWCRQYCWSLEDQQDTIRRGRSTQYHPVIDRWQCRNGDLQGWTMIAWIPYMNRKHSSILECHHQLPSWTDHIEPIDSKPLCRCEYRQKCDRWYRLYVRNPEECDYHSNSENQDRYWVLSISPDDYSRENGYLSFWWARKDEDLLGLSLAYAYRAVSANGSVGGGGFQRNRYSER